MRLAHIGNSLKIVLYGDKFISYTSETPEIPAKVLDSIATFGVGADAADAEFSAIKFQSPSAEPGIHVARAEAAMKDLLAHFWVGGLDQGCIVPTSHGYPAPGLPNARGGLWERADHGVCLGYAPSRHR